APVGGDSAATATVAQARDMTRAGSFMAASLNLSCELSSIVFAESREEARLGGKMPISRRLLCRISVSENVLRLHKYIPRFALQPINFRFMSAFVIQQQLNNRQETADARQNLVGCSSIH